ncbi:MAG: DUF2974 domain-containing protein [Betaproteobacteria bacterium]|nr:DUF2974 domain-containing protein [Betaproteobacteria bacterium]
MSTLNTAGLAAFSDFVYKDTKDKKSYPAKLPSGYVRVVAEPITENGFYASAFYNSSSSARQVVVAFRGSDDIPDWLQSNVSFATGTVPAQFAHSASFLRDVKRALVDENLSDSNYVLTGHSLGGGLAAMMSVVTGIEAVAFDAPKIGLIVPTLQKLQGVPSTYDPQKQ